MGKVRLDKILVILFVLNTLSSAASDNNAKLWYEYPASDWNTQALHIGNGYMGASFYGGVKEERFDISEKTMWTGGPGENEKYNYGIIKGSYMYLEDIRNAIVEGNIEKADKLVDNHFKGDYNGFGAFSTVGSLFFAFDNHDAEVSGYTRELNLAKSLANVSYELDDVKYRREYFASYPDRMIVMNFSSNKSGKRFYLSHGIGSRWCAVWFFCFYSPSWKKI